LIGKYNPQVRIIIGSDGSHSILRKHIFNDKLSYKYNLKYIADYRYTINNTNYHEYDYDLEYRRKQNHENKITTRYFLRETEYNAIKNSNMGGTFKSLAIYNEEFKKLAPDLSEIFDKRINRKGHNVT